MNMEKMKKSKVVVPVILFVTIFPSLFVALFFGIRSDIRKDEHKREPHEVVVMLENAILQGNGALIKQLATSEYAKQMADTLDISLKQGNQNNRALPDNWVMEEYKVDDNHYLYRLMWVDEKGQNRDYLRVKRVNDEWRADGLRPEQFELEIKGMKPEIIRGDKQ